MICNQEYRYNLGKAYIIGTYLKIGGCEKGNIGFFPCQIRKNTPKSKG